MNESLGLHAKIGDFRFWRIPISVPISDDANPHSYWLTFCPILLPPIVFLPQLL